MFHALFSSLRNWRPPACVAVTAPLDDEPLPPSRARQFLLVLLVSLLLIVGVRLWWGHLADRRLRQVIDALHARGEPVTAADFPDIPVADEDNAVTYLRRAIAITAAADGDPTYREEESVANADQPPVTAEGWEQVRRYLARRTEVLALVRTARGKPRIEWHMAAHLKDAMKWPGPGLEFGGLRSVQEVVRLAAHDAHQRGDDAAAMGFLADQAFLSRATHQYGILASYLSGRASFDVMGDDASAYSANLRVGKQPHYASAAQVRALIDILLAAKDRQQELLLAFRGERRIELYVTTCPLAEMTVLFLGPLEDNRPVVPPRWLVRAFDIAANPYRIMRGAAQLERSGVSSDIARRLDDPKLVLPRRQVPLKTGMFGVEFGLQTDFEMNAAYLFSYHYRSNVGNADAAIALAARLFEIDHGQPPRSLQELVPTYLPFVPPRTKLPASAASIRPATGPATISPATLPTSRPGT